MKRLGTILLLGTVLTLGSCGGEAPKPTKVPMPPAGKKATAQAPTPVPLPSSMESKAEPAAVEKYTYDPKGKPDPFKPLIVEKAEAAAPAAGPTQSREAVMEAATPLEGMDLAQLKLVAVIWKISDPKGMVEDATGKGYILSIGTPIGKNRGKVTQITSAGVVVTERYETSSGKFKSREVTLKLYPD